jgi:hypothetical protein
MKHALRYRAATQARRIEFEQLRRFRIAAIWMLEEQGEASKTGQPWFSANGAEYFGS